MACPMYAHTSIEKKESLQNLVYSKHCSFDCRLKISHSKKLKCISSEINWYFQFTNKMSLALGSWLTCITPQGNLHLAHKNQQPCSYKDNARFPQYLEGLVYPTTEMFVSLFYGSTEEVIIISQTRILPLRTKGVIVGNFESF